MTGITRSSDNLDPRRKRILFRAWHRGMREMDLVMGRYVEDKVDGLSDAELDQLEALIDELDADLLNWVTGAAEVPERVDTPVFRAMKAYHKHDSPLDL
jgi:antitoxin CptB